MKWEKRFFFLLRRYKEENWNDFYLRTPSKSASEKWSEAKQWTCIRYAISVSRAREAKKKYDNVSFSLPDVFVDGWLYARYQASKAVKNAPINKIVKA